MALTAEKKAHLQEAGLSAAAIAELESGMAAKAAAAKAGGIEFKDATPAPVAEDVKEEAIIEEPVAEVPATPALTADDIAGVFSGALAPVLSAINDIQARMGTMEAEVKELQVSDDDKIAKAAQMTPRASLEALISQSLLGNPAAQLDGRSALAKSKPKETEQQDGQVTPVGLINKMIMNAQKQEA